MGETENIHNIYAKRVICGIGRLRPTSPGRLLQGGNFWAGSFTKWRWASCEKSQGNTNIEAGTNESKSPYGKGFIERVKERERAFQILHLNNWAPLSQPNLPILQIHTRRFRTIIFKGHLAWATWVKVTFLTASQLALPTPWRFLYTLRHTRC